jgi:hypothetical protein
MEQIQKSLQLQTYSQLYYHINYLGKYNDYDDHADVVLASLVCMCLTW